MVGKDMTKLNSVSNVEGDHEWTIPTVPNAIIQNQNPCDLPKVTFALQPGHQNGDGNQTVLIMKSYKSQEIIGDDETIQGRDRQITNVKPTAEGPFGTGKLGPVQSNMTPNGHELGINGTNVMKNLDLESDSSSDASIIFNTQTTNPAILVQHDNEQGIDGLEMGTIGDNEATFGGILLDRNNAMSYVIKGVDETQSHSSDDDIYSNFE